MLFLVRLTELGVKSPDVPSNRGAQGFSLLIETNRSCRSIRSFYYMKRECLWDFLILVTLFVSLPSRESGYRRLVFTRTKALHIRIYGAQLRTATFYRLNHSHPQTHQSMHPHNNSSEDRDMLFAEVILAARTTASAFE